MKLLATSPSVYPKTTKQVVKFVLPFLKDVKELELVRGDGYYYLVGTFKNGEEFVSGGIYVNRVSHLSMSNWLDSIIDVVAKER